MKLKGPTRCFEACLLRTLYKTAEAFPRAERDDRYGVGRTGRPPGGLRSKAWSSMTAPRGTSTVPSEKNT